MDPLSIRHAASTQCSSWRRQDATVMAQPLSKHLFPSLVALYTHRTSHRITSDLAPAPHRPVGRNHRTRTQRAPNVPVVT